jgi:excisionase family DNA binding protein
MSEKKMLTTSEVAERLGVTRWRVNALIKNGRLNAEKFGQIYLINEKDLEVVKERKPGRPPKPKGEEIAPKISKKTSSATKAIKR